MTSTEFVRELHYETARVLEGLDRLELVEAESGNQLEMPNLLKIALKNELEASELAAYWMVGTTEIDVKLGFARQAGDEAKHYRMIEKLLSDRGVDFTNFNPIASGYSKLFEYLKTLPDTASRLAAGQFTREAIAQKRNEQFIRLCELRGDKETAALYIDVIQPDEGYHHLLGRSMLEKYATDAASQERARAAAPRTLQLAEELRGIAEKKMGVCQIPGC